jgi:hypothetical protein
MSSSIQRLSIGAGIAAWPPPGVTVTTACDVHGGAVPDGAQVLVPVDVAFATLVMLAGGVAESTAVIVYVTAPPTGSVAIVSAIAPLPFAFGQVAPPDAVHVHA